MTRTYGKLTIVSPGLYLGSLPIEDAIGDVENVGERRRLHCRRYENCLTYAASVNWTGFQCSACRVNETLTREDWLADLDGLASFLRAFAGR